MQPPSAPWNAGRLQALASSYWQACALHAAVETGLAAELSLGPATAAQLAAKLELDPRGTRLLLTALTTLGLLRVAQDRYALEPTAAPYLSPGHELDLSNAVLHMADMVPDWAQLDQCVRTGRPVDRPDPPAGDGPPPGRVHFYRAMRDIARQQATGLAQRLGLAAGQHLLDLGGGPGVYGLTFADETPGLKVTVLDLPGSEQFFREEAARHPGAGQASFRPGNFHQADLGGPYDVAWLSQILHGESPEECQALLDRAARALKPGGALWVQEFIVQEVGGHPFPSLFSLNMLVNTEKGQAFNAQELMEMMARAGLTMVEHMGPTREGSPAGLLRGRRSA